MISRREVVKISVAAQRGIRRKLALEAVVEHESGHAGADNDDGVSLAGHASPKGPIVAMIEQPLRGHHRLRRLG